MNVIEITQKVQDGEIDPLKAYIEFKAFEKKFKECMLAVQELAIAESRKYGQKTFTAFNAEITLKSNPGTWTFESDEYYKRKKMLKDFEDQMKASYYAKEKNSIIVDDISGEIITPA